MKGARRGSRLALAALACAAWLAGSLGARADDLETATLSYDAGDLGARCPDAESFARQVAARLGYEPFVPGGKHRVVVRLSAAAGGRVHGHAEVTRAGSAAAGGRELAGEVDKCEALTAALATDVAIALDPLRGMGAPSPPPLPPLPAVEKTEAPPLPPSAASGDEAPPPPAAAEPPRERVALFATAGLLATGWLLPGASFGGSVGIGGRTRLLSLEASARVETMLGPARVDSGDRLEATVFSALLAPCLHLEGWVACALGRVGALQARAPDVVEPSLGTTVFGALGARAGYALPLSRALALRALVSAEIPLVRTILAIDQAPVWIAPPVMTSLELGLVVSPP